MTPGRILLMMAAVLASLLFYVVGVINGEAETWEFAYITSLALGMWIVLVFTMTPGWGAGWRAIYFIPIGAVVMIASIGASAARISSGVSLGFQSCTRRSTIVTAYWAPLLRPIPLCSFVQRYPSGR